MSGNERRGELMSAEWWHAEADRYCLLHIRAQQRIVELEAALRSGQTPDRHPVRVLARLRQIMGMVRGLM